MSRRVRWLVSVALAVNVATILGLVYLYFAHRQWFIDQRYSMFSRIETNAASFDIPPATRAATGFLADSPAEIERWHQRLLDELPALRDLPADFSSWTALDRAKRLAMVFSRGGGVPPPSSAVLIEKFRWLRAGFGYCSDHTECHIALCSIFDVPVYESSSSSHTTTAVYATELKKWVWMDPQYLLVARGADGQLLSPIELRDANLNSRPFIFEYFGDPDGPLASVQPETLPLYNGPENFSDFVMPWGANVFQVDEWRSRLTWLPKPLRQIAYIAGGIMPVYRIYSDQHTTLPARLTMLSLQRWIAIGVVLVVNALAVAAWWRGRRFSKPGQPVQVANVAARPAGEFSTPRAGA